MSPLPAEGENCPVFYLLRNSGRRKTWPSDKRTKRGTNHCYSLTQLEQVSVKSESLKIWKASFCCPGCWPKRFLGWEHIIYWLIFGCFGALAAFSCFGARRLLLSLTIQACLTHSLQRRLFNVSRTAASNSVMEMGYFYLEKQDEANSALLC